MASQARKRSRDFPRDVELNCTARSGRAGVKSRDNRKRRGGNRDGVDSGENPGTNVHIRWQVARDHAAQNAP